MLQTLEAELNRSLRGRGVKIIPHIANHMIGSTYSDVSIKAALQRLLSEGCRKAEILATLVCCEQLVLNMLLPTIEKFDEQTQARHLCGMIERFNGIKDALILASEELWQKRVMQERYSRVLSETRNAWKNGRQITIYNLFDEMPVKASVSIDSWDDSIIHTKVTRELGRVFAACPEMRYAFIDSPIEGFRIKVMIHLVRGDSLQLEVVKVEISEISRREKVRVGLDDYKLAKLYSADRLICTAKISEFSVAGLGLIADEELPFVPGEKLRCESKIGDVQINHMGEITWIQDFMDGGRFGMKMDFDNATQVSLSSEMLNIQRSKIERLSRIGMPPTLCRKS